MRKIIDRLKSWAAAVISDVAKMALEIADERRPRAPLRPPPLTCAEGFSVSEHDGHWCVLDPRGFVRDRCDLMENAVMTSHCWADMDSIEGLDDEQLAALWRAETEPPQNRGD
jgi:hypothetical protein